MQPVIQAIELCKNYGTTSVVKNLSFEIYPGTVFGILGPNGAGKTTTVGMLYGLVKPTSGISQVSGFDVQTQSRQAKSYIGVVAQENNLDQDFTVIENLIYFAHHFKILGEKAKAQASKVLEQVGLEKYATYPILHLSGGLQRRLVLARALLNNPKVVFLDEPTTGLDPDARQDFWKLVLALKNQDCAVLLTTHYMDEAERLCDEILLLKSGEKLDQGSPKSLIERIVGESVVEVDGTTLSEVERITKKYSSWHLTLGNSFVIGAEKSIQTAIIEDIRALQPTRLTLRNADLQDAYLFLTGGGLQ